MNRRAVSPRRDGAGIPCLWHQVGALARRVAAVCAAWIVAVMMIPVPLAGAAEPPSFEKDVLPVLRQRCGNCHDATTRKGRLGIDSVSALKAGGNGGPAVVPGKPEQSPLLEKVLSGEMPPGNRKLGAPETALIREWIKAGLPATSAEGPVDIFTSGERNHWAFRKLESPKVPDIGGIANPIDRFLLSRLGERQLSFAAPVDRAALLRRVTFDLTGLPPKPGEVEAFEKDSRTDFLEHLVDRLLASPQFGVRWGRHWLDIVGYTDTVTFDEDFGEPRGFLEGKWRYRDYVIDALNRDLPYDTFLTEQIAGDELVPWREAKVYSPEIIEKLVATGFLRTAEDISVEDPRTFVLWSNVHETMEQVGSSVLGLSLQCARCHGHKFEPIPHRDYYSMLALFTPSLNPKAWKNARARLLPDASAAAVAEIDGHNREIDRKVEEARRAIASVKGPHEARLREEKLRAVPEAVRADLKAALDQPAEKRDAVQKYLAAKLGPLVKVDAAAVDGSLSAADRAAVTLRETEIAVLAKGKRSHGWIHALYDVGPPPTTHIFKRGDFEKPGAEAPPGFLRILTDRDSESLFKANATPGSSGRRLALARWLTATSQPASGLTARVMVNRIWQNMFGQGISANSENLGVSGSTPSHPELLDWLAADFRDNGWRIKRVIRRMALSRAYAQSSVAKAPSRVDPGNELLWRMNLRRLDAESIRDAIVSHAGRLDERLGGPPVPLSYDIATGRVSEQEPAQGASYRRAVFLSNRRQYNPTLLANFDKPTVTRGACRREASATVQQSLALMNDHFILVNSRHCAARIVNAAPTPSEQVRQAWLLVMGRVPGAEEADWCAESLARQAGAHMASGRTAAEASKLALAGLCQTLWSSNEFLYLR